MLRKALKIKPFSYNFFFPKVHVFDQPLKMILNIWKNLEQILFYHNDLIENIKPFFENLKNENINDAKYIPFLKTFSKDKLEFLYQNGIITEKRFNSLILNAKNLNLNQNPNQSSTKLSNVMTNNEELISGDKINELNKLTQEKDINEYNMISKSFNEVKEMKIPLIQYCIIKKAIECFKFLLINGFDDPNKTMEEQNPKRIGSKAIKRYKWDCMATAIYFGNNEIIKILEGRGIEKGRNPTHIEAAILSYRNSIAKKLIEDLNEDNENNEQIQNFLNIGIMASTKNNNIRGVELLMTKWVDINMHDIELNPI